MSALVFLGAAIALSVLGSLVISFRNRTSKQQGDGVSDFSALMRALAPDDDDPASNDKRSAPGDNR
jgi:hypothetical protein